MPKRSIRLIKLPDGTTRPMTGAEREEHKRDIGLAMALLCGIVRRDASLDWLICGLEFLSSYTNPTEDEGRAALARLLLSGNVPPVVLWALAAVFAPDDFGGQVPVSSPRLAALQNRNQGHSNPDRDWEIAYQVDTLRRDGASFEDACAEVAGSVGRHEDHIKKICGKVNLGFDPPPRARRKPRR
jgi:hypothetical protein